MLNGYIAHFNLREKNHNLIKVLVMILVTVAWIVFNDKDGI